MTILLVVSLLLNVIFVGYFIGLMVAAHELNQVPMLPVWGSHFERRGLKAIPHGVTAKKFMEEWNEEREV